MTLALARPFANTSGASDDSTLDGSTFDAGYAADESAELTELVRAHLPLVGHLVRETLNRVPAQVHRDDLVSAGMFALAGSARSFDPAKGVPFAAYASLRIRGALTDELRSMDWASRGVRGKAREVETARAALIQTLRRIPSSTEVAHAMGLSVKELDAIAYDVHRASVTSLQAIPVEDSDAILPARQDDPESLLVRREQLGYLRDAIAELPDRLRTLVQQYFFEQRRMADIAADLGVTESRVSQLRSEALTMLRGAMKSCTADDCAKAPVGGDRKQTAMHEYAAAVAGRSTLASRLSASSLLAEYCG